MRDIANEIAAAGAIIDIMSGGNLDWRSRINESDFLESADWQTALAYARAALAVGAQRPFEALRLANINLSMLLPEIVDRDMAKSVRETLDMIDHLPDLPQRLRKVNSSPARIHEESHQP